MKASLALCVALPSMADYATASEPSSGKNLWLPNGIPSIPLGNLTLSNGLSMPSGLPIRSDLLIPIGPPITTHFPSSSGHSESTGFHRQSKRQLFGIAENGVTTTLAARH